MSQTTPPAIMNSGTRRVRGGTDDDVTGLEFADSERSKATRLGLS
jgi:hypothetical protein